MPHAKVHRCSDTPVQHLADLVAGLPERDQHEFALGDPQPGTDPADVL
jgi:hypothetical protein